MIVAKVQCKCGWMVRIRTMPGFDRPNYEYGWVLHTHNKGCQRKLTIERKGGHGARIVGTCEGQTMRVVVEYEQ